MSVIVREWRGRTAPDKAGAYPRHFRENVLPELGGIAGFLGARLLRRTLGAQIEFVVLTRWSSLAAIKAFAGDDIEQAVVEPGAIAALADYDRIVQHYELIQETTAG
jgi:heme-degrading monooxygenase HmoA